MNDKSRQTNAKIEREIRERRKFTPEQALARMAGPGAIKGASPVSPVQQAETAIGTWLRSNVKDPSGSLQLLLQRNLKGSELLLENLAQPEAAIAAYCERVLASDYLLEELIREADVEWGRRMDERPYFDKRDTPTNPADPYTIESVRTALSEVLNLLRS